MDSVTEQKDADSRLSVIIVEDDLALREIMQVLLEGYPHNIRFAENAATAIRLVAESHPDLILIDLGLPDMHGFDLARELRNRLEDSEHTKLVAFTGFDGADYRSRATEAGFNEFYPKPMDLDTMEATFAHLMGSGHSASPPN